MTHVLLTRAPLSDRSHSVRLACLIHAASVRSEPESNSPEYIILEIAGPMNSFQVHQYRVTSLRSSAELHLGAGHGTRHDLFLPSLYPLRCSTRKVVPGGAFCNCAAASGKSVNLKIASPGLASPCSLEPLGLSGFTVTVCRESYQKRSRTSSQFF